MEAELVWTKLPAARVTVIVELNLGVTLKADWNRIVDVVTAAIGQRCNVVQFDLDSTEAVAHATPTVALGQELVDLRG